MKVYVDELPKKCLKCHCFNQSGYMCQINNKLLDTVGKGSADNSRDEHCPLQSLTDYTKQVRKKVCDEITELAKNQFEFLICDGCYNTIDKDVYISSIALTDILDQIQGETK